MALKESSHMYAPSLSMPQSTYSCKKHRLSMSICFLFFFSNSYEVNMKNIVSVIFIYSLIEYSVDFHFNCFHFYTLQNAAGMPKWNYDLIPNFIFRRIIFNILMCFLFIFMFFIFFYFLFHFFSFSFFSSSFLSFSLLFIYLLIYFCHYYFC